MLDVKLLLEWGDAITLVSKKFHIPPLLEQAAEKYSQACSIEPSSIICLLKWGTALSRCADSRFKLDFEYNEKLFNLAESKFIEANVLLNNTYEKDDNNSLEQDLITSPSTPPRSRNVVASPKIQGNRSVTTVRESKQGVKVKLTKSSTPKSRLLATVDRNSQGPEKLEYQLLIGWGRCLHRNAAVLDQIGEFHKAMDLSLQSSKLFNRALHIQVIIIKKHNKIIFIFILLFFFFYIIIAWKSYCFTLLG